MTTPPYIVLYRWRLRPGYEKQFEEAWSIVTIDLTKRGSLGSHLHRSNDGLWYAYAQWPNAEARDTAFTQPNTVKDAELAMREATAEYFPEIVLEPIANFLMPTTAIPRLRIARPTSNLHRAVTFWTEIVGFDMLARFEDHDGYDGAIMGHPHASWELEVTHHSSDRPIPSPTEEDLIALYLPIAMATMITSRLQSAGYQSREHPNPYWKAMNASVFSDPDGYTLIIYPMD